MLAVPTNTNPGPHNWQTLLEDIWTFNKDLAQINRFVNRSIQYKRDATDDWRGPRETAKGHGDCEDMAMLKLALLSHPRKWLAVGHHKGNPHAVAVVEDGDKWWVLDNLDDEPYELHGSPFKPAYGLGIDGQRYLFLETKKERDK